MDGPKTMNALSVVDSNSGHCTDFAMGSPQNHIQRGVVGPPANIVLDPSQQLGSQPLLHIKPASSKNMTGFHQLPALSPSKNTFTVGKSNTDNNDIEYFGIFFLPTTGILKLIIREHTQSSVASLS